MISVKRTSVRKMIVGYYVVLPKVQIPLSLVRLVRIVINNARSGRGQKYLARILEFTKLLRCSWQRTAPAQLGGFCGR